MSSLLNTLQNYLEQDESSAAPPARVSVQRQYVIDPSSSRPRLLVRRATMPYWQERGWQRDGSGYTGRFQTPYGSWPGFVRVSPSGRIDVFIHKPPSALERHSHWQCFRAQENDWFFIHAIKPIPDVSAGILSTEKTITEAFQL